MKDRLIVGVDPGLHGAFAVIDAYSGDLVAVEDMPVIGRHVNSAQVAALLHGWSTIGDCRVVLEDVHSFPTDGHVGAFSFGRSKGVVEGCVGSAHMPIALVSPARWKRDSGLRADKDASRQLATNTWPTWSDAFKRKKDDGRAEAALLALWGRAHGEVWGVAA